MNGLLMYQDFIGRLQVNVPPVVGNGPGLTAERILIGNNPERVGFGSGQGFPRSIKFTTDYRDTAEIFTADTVLLFGYLFHEKVEHGTEFRFHQIAFIVTAVCRKAAAPVKDINRFSPL